MSNWIRLLTAAAVVLLSGCIAQAGPTASASEQMRDSFGFTSAQNVSDTDARCVTLTKPFTLVSGSVTFSLPAGKYIARKKNGTGYFYYAPTKIKSSNWMWPDQEGIYLDNQLNKGNVFGTNPNGFDNRPIRGAVLPSVIFSSIKRTC